MGFATRLLIFKSYLSLVLPAALMLAVSSTAAIAQGSVDYTGTGGTHTIQGRIYFPSGRSADAPGLKVRLESVTAGNLSVFADMNGTFSFKNLTAGSYSIVIEETENYAAVRESVYIDDPGSPNTRGRAIVGNAPRIFIVPIHLLAKSRGERKPGVLDATLASIPKAAVELYLRALESSAAANNQRAVAELKSALALYPEFPLALNELGVQYLKMAQPDKAAEALASAVKLAPEELFPRLHYGIALLNQRQFIKSEDQFRLVLQKNNAIPTAHMYLGITLLSQKKLDEAEKELLLARDSNSTEVALIHRYLGGIYWSRRDYKRAADELETYLRLFPKAQDAERTRATIKELRSKR